MKTRTLKNNKEAVRKLVYTESATGLLNCFGFSKAVSQRIENNTILDDCCFCFNIERMGQLNNKFGKNGGDEIIRLYVAALCSALEADEIMCRPGGDFFVALVHKRNRESFMHLLQDVAVKFYFEGQLQCIHISAVAGIYNIEDSSITADDIWGKLVTAYSYAKNVNCTPFFLLDHSMEEKIRRERDLRDKITRAFQQEEFKPYYQPKVDTKSGRIIGAEALARWIHDGKTVSPAEFLPLMEYDKRICMLDFYMLEHVCRDLQYWISQNYRAIEVSVNFSRLNFSRPETVQRICQVIDSYKIPRNLIQIEVTENAGESSLDSVSSFVDELKQAGISAAIDDFGKGDSSIAMLKSNNFKVMKIDKSLADYSSNTEKHLLRGVIQMAKAMSLDVVAEGVEKAEQIAGLNAMGCYVIQGYVFARPLPRERFESEWLTTPSEPA